MEAVPISLDLSFLLITFATVAIFWWIIRRGTSTNKTAHARMFLVGSIAWLTLQGILAYRGVYTDTLAALPPRIAVFGMIPAFLTIVGLAFLPAAKHFSQHLPLREMTLIHTIRVPVELVLYGLFIAAAIPEVLTFAGRNFDILAGLTAPVVFYYAFRPSARKSLLIVWNLVCLGLLLSVVIHALLSAPFPLQQLAFDQPNVAVLHFPYVWLPTYVVPVVTFCHLVSLRGLLEPSR